MLQPLEHGSYACIVRHAELMRKGSYRCNEICRVTIVVFIAYCNSEPFDCGIGRAHLPAFARQLVAYPVGFILKKLADVCYKVADLPCPRGRKQHAEFCTRGQPSTFLIRRIFFFI